MCIRDRISGIVNMMYELDSIADVIIIDTGAGISDAVIDMVLASSEVLLVTTPEPTSITDAYALLKTINKAPVSYTHPCLVRSSLRLFLITSVRCVAIIEGGSTTV